MTLYRVCCCGPGAVVDCCDMQTNCATFVAPNTITITYTGSITRNYSNGASHVLVNYTYTIASNSAFSQVGNSCRGTRRTYYCPTANVSYDYTERIYAAAAGTEYWYDPLADECSGCTDPDLECKTEIDFCLSETHRNYGPARSVGKATAATGILEYTCCDSCGCVRPSILYQPAAFGTMSTIADRAVFTPGCCTSSPATDIQGAHNLPDFEISGACGCPSSTTWVEIVSDPDGGCDANGWRPPATASTNFNFFAATCGAMDCNGLPIGVCSTGKSINYTWQCVDLIDEVVVTRDCSITLGYEDICAQTMTVTIT